MSTQERATPLSFAQATLVVAARDPVLARLVQEAGPVRIGPTRTPHFASLAQSIVYQQIAGAAAHAIHARLVAALPGGIEPRGLLALSEPELRGLGLSTNKARALHDLAAKVTNGDLVLTPRHLSRLSDEEVLTVLTSVRGIGPWTAQMFLIFQLRRMDIWPAGDHGLREGYGLAWNVPTPTARELEPLGDPFRPYRTVVAWYCWRAGELRAPKR